MSEEVEKNQQIPVKTEVNIMLIYILYINYFLLIFIN